MKYLISITLLAGILFSCSRQPSVPANEYLLQGTLSNAPDSLLVQLFEKNETNYSCAFVDTIIGGTFTFRDTLSVPRIVYIRGRWKGFPSISMPVWVAPGKYTQITGKDKQLYTWKIKSDIPEQIEENGYQAQVATERTEQLKLMAVENELMHSIRYEQDRSPEAIKQDKAKRDSIRKLVNNWGKVITKKTLSYMRTAPITPIWMDKLLSYSKSLSYSRNTKKEDIEELYNRLPEEQKQTENAKLIASYLYPSPMVNVGDDMVDSELYDVQGNTRHLSEYQGKYILLDFWNNSCGPCIASIPEMKKVEEQYKDQLEVVGISDDDDKIWKASLQEHGLQGNQWKDRQTGGNSLAERYQTYGIPHYVLITPGGKIQDMWTGYGKGSLLAKLKEHLQS